jgi:hypothetical protein
VLIVFCLFVSTSPPESSVENPDLIAHVLPASRDPSHIFRCVLCGLRLPKSTLSAPASIAGSDHRRCDPQCPAAREQKPRGWLTSLQTRLSALPAASSSSSSGSGPLSAPSAASVSALVDQQAGQSSSHAAATAAAAPRIADLDGDTWSELGWMIVSRPASDRSAASFARRVVAFAKARLADDASRSGWGPIRGGLSTFDFLKEESLARGDRAVQQMHADLETHMRKHLALVTADSTPAALCLRTLAILRSESGKGEQSPHFDIVDFKKAERCYSVILYCVDTATTAVPLQSSATNRALWSDSVDPDHHLLLPPNFHSYRVGAGALLIFRATVIHHGVPNPMPDDRFIAFGFFSPTEKAEAYSTKNQRYPITRDRALP